MHKIVLKLLVLFATIQVQAQLNVNNKNISEISIVKSSIEKIHLKKGRDKVFLSIDSITFQRDYYNFNTKETYTFKKQLKNEGFNIRLDQLQNLAKGKQIIDKAPIYIETFFVDDTNGKQMIFSNELIEGLFANLITKYKNDMSIYVNQLPSGKYGYPMFINRRIKENKSEFYKVIENELIAKGITDEDIFNQPVIYINKTQSTFDELNQLDINSIESYKILNGKVAEALYGSSTKNGVIIISLK